MTAAAGAWPRARARPRCPPPPEFCAAAERNSGLAPRYARRPSQALLLPLLVLPFAAQGQPPTTELAGTSVSSVTLTCADPSSYTFIGDAYGYTDGQFRRWREGLFPDGRWPDDLRDDVAYCVVGSSSPARFRGFKDTNSLNLEAANRRGRSMAEALAAYLSGQGVDQVVAACHWCDFGTMSRPEAVNGEHLTDEDRWLFNRAAIVYPISLDENEQDLGLRCTESVAERVCGSGIHLKCAKCLQCSKFKEWT